jgi:pimeloyl-ACP methyl ester carboxylesterase
LAPLGGIATIKADSPHSSTLIAAMPRSFETRFVDVAGRKTQVTVGGDGPPLVYLHSAAGETGWTSWHAALAEHFTLYAPAHPGFDESAGLDDIDDIDDLAWHTIDLLATLGLANVPIVGLSLGAWLALEASIRRPATIGPLVLIDAAGLYVPGAPMAEIFIDDVEKAKRLMFLDPKAPVVDEIMPSSLDDPRVLLWLRAREATARVGWNPYLHNPRLRRHLHRVTSPTLILWGREDRLIPLAHGEAYAAAIPGSRLEVFDHCGHMLPYERTTDAVRRIVGWLAEGR